ncbi:LysE/ArgO family amino acid transporter [Phytoactinopolyspora limicola]|uniref:LysE/ArgO family amino acid transporter n=1 Tax=Phytoactinopolyspora limicola TaxID=2715536 RepID=UPI001A9C3C38|nr:LysE/ArgO family amino acid transporter [Phytoactinopolyspora limicola]
MLHPSALPGAAPALVVGFATGLSLIIAIGAQNAFVLRQGLRREHVLPVVLLCATADAALITAGIAGLGALITAYPQAMEVARYAGAAFVAGYGMLAVRRALRPQGMAASAHQPAPLRAALLTCLAFTFLNPHVYLDTVVLLGSIGSQYGDGRWAFAAGATAGSFTWFFALGYGATRLTRLFARPGSWRVLDLIIAAIMFALAALLLFSSR